VSRFPWSLLFAMSLAAAPVARADLLLNEVLYDPEGPDEGLEFVELWNPDSIPLPLDGVLIEAGDGARPDSWVALYSGAAGDTVPPGSPFLVAGSVLVEALQNGPDAVRLSRGGGLLDLLGYGALAVPALYEGSPAPDAGSGQSLARRRDGVDTGMNADDWEAIPSPTPGRANRPELRLEFAPAGVTLDPEVAWPGEEVALRARVRNTGWRSVEGSLWAVEVEIAGDAATGGSASDWIPVASSPGVSIAPAESALVACTLRAPAAGAFRARARLRGLSSAPALGDTSVVAGRSVAGPVVVNEFAFHNAGAGEWIELWFRETVPDVGAISISDASGRPQAIDGGAGPRAIEIGALLVIAEDPDALRARFGLADSVVLGLRGTWPSLNDTGSDDSEADRIRVLESDGSPSDAVPYRGDATERGGSLERLSPDLPSAAPGTWAESIDDAGGTPGRSNSLRAPGAGSVPRGPLLVAAERVMRRPAGGEAVPIVLRTTSEARGRRLTVRVHDVLGRALRTLVDGQRFAAEGAFLWDGRDDRGRAVPPGLYLIRAEAMPEEGAPSRATNLPLAVAVERGR